MPPPEAGKEPLSAEEQQVFKRWIETGAPYEEFWAFVPAKVPALPEVADSNWSQQPIDLHVLKGLESEGLTPSQEADKRTLIRRVTFDLTGLPPTREEVREFLADESSNAYESLVDRLLAKPQFGEHMARYWLDAARYADTNGYQYDTHRNMWPWRDWVINAYNRNLPFLLGCLLYTSPRPRDGLLSRMPSSS